MTSMQSSTPAPTVDSQSTCYDPLDVDAFINFEQLRSDSSSLSPASSQSVPSTGPGSSKTRSTSVASNYPSYSINRQDNAVGPSHQYDLHKQQTGLPVGALANTLALNPANSFATTSQAASRSTGSGGFFDASSTANLLDFNSPFGVSADADLAIPGSAGEDLPAFFFPESTHIPSNTEFVNPSNLGVSSDSSLACEPPSVAPITTNSVGRLYPGMHSQQAALAKAQQEQNQQSLLSISQPIPHQQVAQQTTDALVEERISRLLKTMRHSSTSSSDGDVTTPNAGGAHAHVARLRKEEEDMDEDERLLASEEGKKLSSKERRQLRNKVSARAFRSRRKEYIGQLEGEVAAKVNEADDLRLQNRALMEENRRLSDLTRMLLSSSAFSTFLDDLSNPEAQAPLTNPTPRNELPKVNTQKDADPYAVAQRGVNGQEQLQQQPGSSSAVSGQMDLSTTETDMNSTWPSNFGTNGVWGVTQPRVFSVFEVPQVPAIDRPEFQTLSGKTAESSPFFISDENKQGPGAVEHTPIVDHLVDSKPMAGNERSLDFELDDADPALALYAGSRASRSQNTYRPLPHDPERREKYRLHVPGWGKMLSYVQVITTPTSDTPGTALLLHFDNKRYIIGQVTEGTSRACGQQGIKLPKLGHILLTGRLEWANQGGLIGMILTVADAVASSTADPAGEGSTGHSHRSARPEESGEGGTGNPSDTKATGQGKYGPTLTIHGGPNLTHTIATARRFVFRRGVPLQVNEMSDAGQFPTSNDSATPPRSDTAHLDSRKSVADLEHTRHTVKDTGHFSSQQAPTWMDENIQVWGMQVYPSTHQEPLSPGRPRRIAKRSFDESNADMHLSSSDHGAMMDAASSTKLDDMALRQSVISAMFGSQWSLDDMQEIKLSRVRMPAAVFVRNPETHALEPYRGPRPQEGFHVPGRSGFDPIVLARRPWPGVKTRTLPPTRPSAAATSYIIKNHPQRGKFQPDRARALNVEMGQKWAELTRGKNVKSSTGATVTPEMVMAPRKPGNGFAVVDLPAAEYVSSLIHRHEWKSKDIMEGVAAIVWILGPGVAANVQLRDFIAGLPQMRHVMSSTDHCPNYLAFESSSRATIRLHQVDPARFPIPLHDNITLPQTQQPVSDTLATSLTASSTTAQRGTVIQLEPKIEIRNAKVTPFLNTRQVLEETPTSVLQLAQEAKANLEQEDTMREIDRLQRDLPSKNAEIITLGTGSATPGKYRNVAGTLLRVPGYGSYLFDCGENTLGQLRRLYSADELNDVLRDLRAIWISHLHADHHLGTTSVIKAWYRAQWHSIPDPERTEPFSDLTVSGKALKDRKGLFVISGLDMLSWLNEYADVEDYGYSRILPLEITSAKPGTRWSSELLWFKSSLEVGDSASTLTPAVLEALELDDIQAVAVEHCHGAKAVSMTFPNGFKVSYSGDCRPSQAFAQIGRGSTVLIHEATFEDTLGGDALAKKHSTTGEAIDIGIAMGARRILLTHFSQRYPKIPVIDNSATDRATAAAQDKSDPLVLSMSSETPGERSFRPRQERSTKERSRSPEDGWVKKTKPPTHDMKIGLAFDYMRVKVGEISHMEHFTPALIKLYEAEDADDAEDATAIAIDLDPPRESRKTKKSDRKDDDKATRAAKDSQKARKHLA
ncbi:MAG: hypothetical protein M1817_001135 [Caeruleum heppii]|nr:MAG: hypothetical protein M1817_001135 [Caeruleum heppii]